MHAAVAPTPSTLTDRIYRWLAKGGGHVNAFRRPEDVVEPVERLAYWFAASRPRIVYTAQLSFLNRRNPDSLTAPRRIALFLNGSEQYLRHSDLWVLRTASTGASGTKS